MSDLFSAYTNDVAGKKAELLDETRADMRNMAKQLKAMIQNRFNSIFRNSRGLTPQQALDAFGTSAADMLLRRGQAVTFIQTIDPTYVPPLPASVGYALTPNPDGTVTASEI